MPEPVVDIIPELFILCNILESLFEHDILAFRDIIEDLMGNPGKVETMRLGYAALGGIDAAGELVKALNF